MAWEWLAPVATGVVGIGGMIITSRVGRYQQIALDKRSWIEFRRTTYMKYLAAVDAIHYSSVDLFNAKLRGADEVEIRAREDEITKCLKDLTSRREEVLLVASDQVADLVAEDAHETIEAALKMKQLLDVGTGGQHHANLIIAMRNELILVSRWRRIGRRKADPKWVDRYKDTGDDTQAIATRARNLLERRKLMDEQQKKAGEVTATSASAAGTAQGDLPS